MNIPNLPALSPIVDENRIRTPIEQIFMQQLITELQQNVGNEGFVVPGLTAAQITMIQNNKNIQGQYTLAAGTIIRNTTAEAINPLTAIMISVTTGGVPPVQFKTVTLS